MQIAVTNHAVDRYQQRVPSAAKLTPDAIRTLMRRQVEEAFVSGTVKDHPGYPDRRMVPFAAGPERMFLALGPNDTGWPGEWAVIGVLFDKEIGKSSMGTTIGDIISQEVKTQLTENVKQKPKTRFLVRIKGSKEVYDAQDDVALADLLERRRPNPDEVEIFERTEYLVKTKYVVEKVK